MTREGIAGLDDDDGLVMFDAEDIIDIEQTTTALDNRLTQKASGSDLQDVVNVYAEMLKLTE